MKSCCYKLVCTCFPSLREKIMKKALEEIAKPLPEIEAQKEDIHTEKSGSIFAAASAKRMEIARNALAELEKLK